MFTVKFSAHIRVAQVPAWHTSGGHEDSNPTNDYLQLQSE
jgi:hypothetical protein